MVKKVLMIIIITKVALYMMMVQLGQFDLYVVVAFSVMVFSGDHDNFSQTLGLRLNLSR